MLRTSLTISLTGLTLIAASSHAAMATDWQYCLAPSHLEHKIYMSATFPAHGTLGEADSAFEQLLERASLPHDDVQCPRADDEHSILLMQQYTISFNQRIGNTIVHLPLKNTR